MGTTEKRIVAKPIQRSLWRHTSIMASMTMMSRVLGFVRDMITAQLFGATVGTDAFLVAFKIPNFLRRLSAEGAFSQAFVPILSEYQQQRSEQEVRQFISHAAGMLCSVLFIVTIIALIAAPVLIFIFAPGFKPGSERFIWAVDMLRITFPYLFLISLASLAGAVLNTYGSFGIPAFTPVLLNLAMIGTALYLTPYIHPPVYVLAWGVLLGGLLQLGFQIPFLMRFHLLPMPRLNWKNSAVRRMLKQMVPVIYGTSVSQINLMFDTLLASFLPIGSVSWLYYSDRITSLPLGVFGVAIATVMLPHLSRQFTAENTEGFSRTTDWALRTTLLISVPATIGFVVLGKPILITLFQYGHFNFRDVLMTERSLIAFAIGIPAFMCVKVLASAFYSQHNIRTPVRIATVAMLCNMVLNVVLIWAIAHAGLALATSLAAYINSGLLFYYLRKQHILLPDPRGWFIFFARLLTAIVGMATVVMIFVPVPAVWQQWNWKWRCAHLALWITIAFITYAGLLFATGLRKRDLTVH